ncbi:hypothetical protein RU639_012198 [Aspergillus parasiticus]
MSLQFLPRLNDDTADHEKNNGTNVSHICLVHHWCVSSGPPSFGRRRLLCLLITLPRFFPTFSVCNCGVESCEVRPLAQNKRDKSLPGLKLEKQLGLPV